MTSSTPGRMIANPRTGLWLAGGLLVAAIAAPAAAEARGFVAFNFGLPLAGPPAYYYPPPVYYYPPPVYYAPPAASYAPPAVPAPAYGQNQQGQGQNCRQYQSSASIDGTTQPTYGTACLQPDGTWQIVH